MFDLYLSPILGQEHFTLEELGQIRMIKNKAHIICYTKNISFNEALKIVLNKYYTLNPINAFEYIFINYQKKVEFQYLIVDVNDTQYIDDEIDDIDKIDKHLYQNNINNINNNKYVKKMEKNNDKLVSIFNVKKMKKIKKNVIFNIEQNEIIEFDNGK
jgi:hypothetical protein